MTDPKKELIDEMCERFVQRWREMEGSAATPHNSLATLRELLADAVVVYGSDKRPLDGWNEKQYESTSHVGLLISTREKKRKVKVSEIVDALRSASDAKWRDFELAAGYNLAHLAKRIEKHGIEAE